jgi:hypothetical protein
MYCPICDMEKVDSQLLSEPMKIFCERNPVVHTWNDISKLMALNYRLMKKPKEADKIQPSYTKLELMVPESLKKDLEAKFPENLSASVRSVLQACAQPMMMILSTFDIKKVHDMTGQLPKTSGQLCGIIFAFKEEVKEMKNEIVGLKKRLTIQMRGNEAGVIVDLGEMLPKAVAKADAAGVSLEQLLSNHLQTALGNDWLEG